MSEGGHGNLYVDSAEITLGAVRESVLITTNDFVIWGASENLSMLEKFACWMNGWLPRGWRLGQINGRWRLFRP